MTDHLQTLCALRTARFEDTNHPRVSPAEHEALSYVIGLLKEPDSAPSPADQTAATGWKGGDYVSEVALRDAAVAYRARIACDILEGFADGIDGDRLGELARWITHGRALDNVALHRAFAAPWIAAADEAAWKGDPDVEAVKDIERHTIAARVRGATSFTPDQLATIFARQNQLKAAATAVSAIRPSNWNDGEDREQQEAWTALDEALK